MTFGSAAGQTDPIIQALESLVEENRQERVAVSGAANLVRTENDFDGFAPLLEIMEEQVALMKLLRETELDSDGLGISIGAENQQQELSSASFLVGEYGDQSNSARVGILGPTRMNYRGNIASLRTVARYLSKSMNGN
jgi:Transcriptional regulator of heat shock gene